MLINEVLSNELLLEIFEHLNGHDLKFASEVCIRWSELIGTSPSTMKNFRIKMDSWRASNCSEGQISTWCHQHLNVYFHENFDEVVDRLDRFNLSHIKLLELYGSQKLPLSKLLDVVRKFPRTENFDLNMVAFENDCDDDTRVITLSRLEIMNIDSINCQILQFLETPVLTDIRVNGYRDPVGRDVQVLTEFLKRCRTLKTLKLNRFCFMRIFEFEYQPNFGFQLKKFSSCEITESAAANFGEFLKVQKSLEVLKLWSATGFTQWLLSTIFQLPNLKSLRMTVSDVPEDRMFYEKLKPLTSLRKLKISGHFPSEEALKGFLGNCPNIEKLSSEDYEDNSIENGEDLEIVASFNQQLRILVLNKIMSPIVNATRFNNLMKFEVNMIVETDHWMSIILSSPKLETITVGSLKQEKITDGAVDLLLQHPSLCHIKLDGEYVAIKPIFDKIKINYGNLKSLDLVMSETSEFGTTVTATVKFFFPKDSAEWKIEEQDEKFEKAWDYRSW